ncbi:3-phosphoshikimate 1-carboxyvinyltransferase [Pueribacillus theae]|uniref:3-phosphoshikimate 1-carboxyvinyltransferase n=1 Tax=Pueribacillus theae TaxID=2171751 RepID=A0A2U1K4N7_9BACI|nr:3-phosphoshikimate 1-carboxyvinyltransferase [Pueribacillus theae]PWA12362.1 3-phosphoshikimate 1-carboxyvinyltransferase [Pueribacillus theae]
MGKRLSPANQPLQGELKVPGDKSISHRSIMLGAVANGTTTIKGFLPGEDCINTIKCFKKLGVPIEIEKEDVIVVGNGFEGLQEPNDVLYVGNSGTLNRLLLGLLAGRPFHSVLYGDESIASRPMDRVAKPLRQMGAVIDGRKNGSYPPISVRGGNLKGIEYESPVASAQVKSAILLAGLQANGVTTITEPALSRDHTERMLTAFGVELKRENTTVSLEGNQRLHGTNIQVPADISSAAFFIVTALITKDSELTLTDVGMNPTRSGIVDALLAMGANITMLNERQINGEPVADLHIKSSPLKNIEINGELIPRLIDEIPILALAATQAEGKMVISDAEELKVKETNRIDAVVNQLRLLGANIEATEDGMIIEGRTNLHGGTVDSLGDHRIGMMLAIASLVASGEVVLQNEGCISISYPDFFPDLANLKNN